MEIANSRQHFYVSSPELWYSLLEFNSLNNCQRLMNWTRWKKRDKVWSSATSLLIKVAFSLPFRRRCCCLIGTLRNYDDDGNTNVQKAIGLMSKTTTLHVHHAFLYISLLFLHNYNVKWPNVNLLENRNGKAINSSISVWTRARAPLFSSNQNSILSSNRANWDNREKN